MSTKLPEIIITTKLQADYDKLFLDFLSSLYLISHRHKKLNSDTNVWFLQEIAFYLFTVYPEKSTDELEQVLRHIVEMTKQQEKIK